MQDPTTCSQSYRFRTHPSFTPQVTYLVCGTTDRRRSNEPMPTPHQLQPADRSNCQHHAKANLSWRMRLCTLPPSLFFSFCLPVSLSLARSRFLSISQQSSHAVGHRPSSGHESEGRSNARVDARQTRLSKPHTHSKSLAQNTKEKSLPLERVGRSVMMRRLRFASSVMARAYIQTDRQKHAR
jgi:hypothetical protein